MSNIKELTKKIQPLLLSQYISNLTNCCCLFASFSDMYSQAIVIHIFEQTVSRAWDALLLKIDEECNKRNLNPTFLKIDWIIDKRQLTFHELTYTLSTYKRNHFKYGISFDLNYEYVFLESELNANMMLYQSSLDYPSINMAKCNAYCRLKYDKMLPDLTYNTLIEIFTTNSIFTSIDDPSIRRSSSIDNWCGIRDLTNKTNTRLIDSCLYNSISFLLGRIKECCGKYNYNYYAGSNTTPNDYNILRHLGATLSLLEFDKYYKNNDLHINDNAHITIVSLLRNNLQRYAKEDFFTYDGVISIGSSGLGLLVLCKYKQLYNYSHFDSNIYRLAEGILRIQQEDGRFIHKLDINLQTISDFSTIYYTGECIYGLLEAYKVFKDDRYLSSAKRALDYWIDHADEYIPYMDHWISYAIREIIKYCDDYKYYKLAYDLVLDKLKFIYDSQTIYSTLLELLVNVYIIFNKMRYKYPELYNKIDMLLLKNTIEHRSSFQLTGYGWPEVSIYFKKPNLIQNSFFIRHQNFRVRIDDIQHVVLALLLYLDRDFYERN